MMSLGENNTSDTELHMKVSSFLNTQNITKDKKARPQHQHANMFGSEVASYIYCK